MRRRMLLLSAVLCGALLLQGCSLSLRDGGQETEPCSRMVLQVTVESLPENPEEDRIYTEPEKIQAVLHYIGGLELTRDYSNEPASSGGATRKITVHYSGGASRTYFMAGESYLREVDSPWQCLENAPKPGLAEILQKHSSDMTAVRREDTPNNEF